MQCSRSGHVCLQLRGGTDIVLRGEYAYSAEQEGATGFL